ncbi:NAD(P)/FAD-dependent oxidoreductase [Rhodocytophaga aerolata]|uniref:NAD(P)/FAD-dependent oxidoreductase n=2 Tax=Rhodocytophaga aerolata TaxID=455078 RepID=A0ABT8RFJ8_9BACT|nr:NAD(P)/FAD-dependent oxidoreductase [Rhodocytophaga aerolata]MDO1449938.1 NAD(P)/FAD-dependent oxidoreductase [Rhodocytophaga aerolata]
MAGNKNFDTIIIGGSYAGLSAAMALGRALRNVLIIDSGLPCNRQTPYSHNFITQDGEKPSVIAEKAKTQVLNYNTVKFHHGLAVSGKKTDNGFAITTHSDEEFKAKKLIFATGVKDIMPTINGFAECWGISLIHCPYCHGYEVKNERTGILANGNFAFHYAQLIRNWTKDLTIFTNGKSLLTPEQTDKITKHNIPIIEKEIAYLKHEKGKVEQIVFKDNSTFGLRAIYSRPDFEQHCKIPETLGCELTEQGLLKVDMFQKTTVANVFACGDNASPMRSIAYATATGNITGSIVNGTMAEEEFH